MTEEKKDAQKEAVEAATEEVKTDVKAEETKPAETQSEAPVQAEAKEVKKEAEIAPKEDDKSPELKPGMTVRVYQKIKELNIKGEEKERVQYFEGMIIAMKHGKEIGATMTVRKVTEGIGVEKIFPLNLPTIEKVIVKKEAKVNRAKLYFLKRGYKKKLKETVVKK